MSDWLIAWLAPMQGDIMKALAAELRAGSLGTAWLAFGLGSLHALTPGHGKAALAAYMLGHASRITTGLRIALTAAMLHVLSGLAIFLVFRFVLDRTSSVLGRPSPAFTTFGYGLIALAGVLMLVQSLQGSRGHRMDGAGALTAGIGLLPCPLTISVLGFAWSQSSTVMVATVLLSLGLGIALTIGLVAAAAVLARLYLGAALASHLPVLDRWAHFLQGLIGALILALAIYTIAKL